MPTIIATGFSAQDDPAEALREACVMAKTQTGLDKSDLAIVFVTPSHAAIPLETIHKILKPEKLIGSVAPALVVGTGVKPAGVAVLSLTSDEIHTGIAALEQLSLFPLQDAALRFSRNLASRLESFQRHGAILFCDQVALNHTQLVRGLQEGLGLAFSTTGVISPGGIFCQEHLRRDAIGGLIFGGQTQFAASWRHGWQPLGKPRIVTEAEGNLIRTIDGRPASWIYHEYFREEMTKAVNSQPGDIGLRYPLGLNTSTAKEYIIKIPVEVLPDGGIVCQGDVVTGTQLHLMIGDKDACRKASHDAAIDVRDKLQGGHPRLVFIFLSHARQKLFGRSAWQEVQQIKEILGLACPVFGMYTYGEIASAGPIRNTIETRLHNAGVLVAALG